MKLQSLILTVLLLSTAPAQAQIAPGAEAPDFKLTDITGVERSLSEFAGKFVVLEWTNYQCPFVRKHYDSGNMQELQRTYVAKDVVWLSVNSSAPGKQGHYTPEEWQKLSVERGVASTAILLDPDGRVGKTYGAKTTPHLFVIDPSGRVIYEGAIDDRPGTDPAEIPQATNYARQTLDRALAGEPLEEAQTIPYGCSVKY